MNATATELAEFYLSVGQPDRALAALDGAGLAPDDPHVLWLRGAALFEVDRYDEAADLAGWALAADPENPSMLWLACVAEAQRGRLPEAERAILAALELDPEDSTYLCTYADIVARAGQFDKAERLIAEAARVDPEDPAVLSARIDLAYLRGDQRRLEALTRELLATDPESRRGHQMMGMVMLRNGAAADAVRHWSDVVRSDPTDESSAEAARDARVAAHPLMIPMRPMRRLGPGGTWVAAIVVILVLRGVAPAAGGVAALTWFLYCIYTWVVPGIVERRVAKSR